MLQDVEQVAELDVKDSILEADARSHLSVAFFASSQATYFSGFQGITMCA